MAKKHTGKMAYRHQPMHAARKGGVKDSLAHPTHHSMNKEHGTPGGLSPKDEEYAEKDQDGEGMAGNCCYE